MNTLRGRQSGAALIALLAVIMIAIGAIVLGTTSATEAAVEREQKTALALGRARDLLVSRAAADLTRPGSLPCPDTDNDGDAELFSFGGACPSYVGRLPIETLEAPDLHDGNGERLWYAMSPRFRDHASGGTLNSDIAGELTVTGTPAESAIIAIVFSAGEPLATQNRVGSGLTIATNYLEGENAGGTPNTYERQPTSATFNDRLLTITAGALFPAVERRVTREARNCLMLLAADMGGRHPWAAPLTDTTLFADVAGTYFGRLPRTLDATKVTDPAAAWRKPAHTDDSPPSIEPNIQCLQGSTWWDDWRQHIFYAVAPAYAPSPAGTCPTDCLSVNSTDSVKAVVIVAGRTLNNPDQSARSSDPTNAGWYLEVGPGGVNNALGGPFWKAPAAVLAIPQYNDKTECLHETAGTFPC